mgnify:CR=1 FL=1
MGLLFIVSCSSGSRSDEAFDVLRQEFTRIRSTAEATNDELMTLLQRRVANSGEDQNAMVVFQRATMSVALANDLEQFLEDLKKQLVEYDEAQSFEDYMMGEKLVDGASTDAAQDVLLGRSFQGKELKMKINEARKVLVGFAAEFEGADTDELERLDSLLHLHAEDQAEPTPEFWEFKMFDGLSKSAALTMLDMIENQVFQAERVFLQTCLNQTSSSGLRISEFEVVSVPNNCAIALGDTFKSRVFLTGVLPIEGSKVLVDSKDITQSNSIGEFEIVADKKGIQSHKTQLLYENRKTGKLESYEGEIRYYVY